MSNPLTSDPDRKDVTPTVLREVMRDYFDNVSDEQFAEDVRSASSGSASSEDDRRNKTDGSKEKSTYPGNGSL